MTKRQLVAAMEKYKERRVYTRVRVNADGHRAFSDVDGEFYLMGFSQQYIIQNGKPTTTYIGCIARVPSSYQRSINAVYLDEVK